MDNLFTTESQRHRENRKTKRTLENSSSDALGQQWNVEINEKTDSLPGQLHVCEQLGFMNR
jgi:hypothetical protein